MIYDVLDFLDVTYPARPNLLRTYVVRILSNFFEDTPPPRKHPSPQTWPKCNALVYKNRLYFFLIILKNLYTFYGFFTVHIYHGEKMHFYILEK